MVGHEPRDYDCPFCALVVGDDSPVSDPKDIVARTDDAVAFISPRWWPKNRGHVHVFPRHNGDQLYGSQPRPGFVPASERRPYAIKLRAQLTRWR